MKSIKQIALTALLTVSAFCAVLYTSCSKDACKDVVCNNGGTCSGGTCTCPTGYIGTKCETHAFIGTWTGTDACSPSGTYNVNIVLSASSTDTSKVLINNPGRLGTNNTISGTLSSDAKTITYTNQYTTSLVGTVTYTDTVSGTLTLTDHTHFTHAYSDKSGTTSTCTGNYTKQ